MSDLHAPRTGWEDDGGAGSSGLSRRAEAEAEGRLLLESDQRELDIQHDAARRGEHRFPATHQRESEQRDRDARDHLRRRLRGHMPPASRRHAG